MSAALDVFSKHGYEDARVELITDAAGCSRPAFYQYFSSRDDVFWSLAGHLANDMGRLAENTGAITADAEGVAQLRKWLNAFIDLCTEYDAILTGYQAATREHRPDAKDTRIIGNRVGAAIVRAAGPGHPELDRPALTNTLVGVIMRAIFYWQRDVGQLSRRRFVDAIARTVHRTLHGPLDGVNVMPPSKPPPSQVPPWPPFPGAPALGRSLRARGRVTRQKLLDAASVVLPIHGYHNTRVDDIVTEAGVSHGSFYRFFDNKDSLFHVLAGQAAVALVELVNSFPDGAADDELRAWLQRWFATYRANGGVISAWQEINFNTPDLASFSIDIATVMLDRLHRIVHRRGFGDGPGDALVLLSVIERIPYSVVALGHIGDDEAIDASTFLVRRGVFGA